MNVLSLPLLVLSEEHKPRPVVQYLFTFVRHHFTCFEVHLDAAGIADLVDIVAKFVAAVLSAAETQALIKSLFGIAAVGHALLLGVQQRVDEEVD